MAVGLIQQVTGSIGSAATTAAATFPASTAGALLVAVFSNAGGLTNTISGVTDSSSTAWTQATTGATSGVTNTRTAMFYRENCPAGITSATATFSASVIGHWHVSEWSGIVTASSLDVASPTNSSQASATTIPAPSITTTVDDLIIEWWHASTTTATSPGGAWTDLTDATDASGMTKLVYQAATAGTYQATWTSLGAAKAPGIGSASFKAAASVALPTIHMAPINR